MSPAGKAAYSAAVTLVLLCALAAYGLAALFGAAENSLQWVEAERRTVVRCAAAEGIVIRSELPLESGSAAEGKRLGAGVSIGNGVAAPAAGIFSSRTDGLEYLSPADIVSADAESIAALLSSSAQAAPAARLVTGKDWYYAALLPEDFRLAEGQSASVNFLCGEVKSEVIAAGEGWAVLRMDTQLTEHLCLRRCSAEIITEKISGLAIPDDALRKDSEGSYVWVITAGRLEKKTVNIISAESGFYLAEALPEAEALREGDRLVTAGDELYEGKILT